MIKIVELVGTLAPVVVLVFLFVHRRRAPLPVGIGMTGALLAGAGSLTELISSRVVWFGNGGVEGAFERLEGWGMLRFALVISGIVLLVIAALTGPGRTMPRIPLAIGGIIIAAAGCGLRFVHIHLDDPDHVALVSMAIEIVQFAVLGVAVLMLGLAVVSGRDDGPEPLRQATAIARRAAHAVQKSRARRPDGRSGSGPATGSVWGLVWDSIAGRGSESNRSSEPRRREDGDADER